MAIDTDADWMRKRKVDPAAFNQWCKDTDYYGLSCPIRAPAGPPVEEIVI